MLSLFYLRQTRYNLSNIGYGNSDSKRDPYGGYGGDHQEVKDTSVANFFRQIYEETKHLDSNVLGIFY